MKMKLPLLLILFLVACNLPISTSTPVPSPTIAWTVYPTAAALPSFTPTPSLVPSIAPTLPTALGTKSPGLLVRGRVTLDGKGLAGVKILRSYAAYPAEQIAFTDANGYYQSAFMGIPGDEMVTVSAELSGYTFDPSNYYWHHYYGYEESTCDFAASLTP